MNKMISFKFDWLLWFLILLPTFYVVGMDIRHAQMNFFQISIIILLGLIHVNKYIGWFLLWVGFQFLFFDVPNKSYILQNIFFGALLYHLIVKYDVTPKKYLWAIMWLLVFNAFWVGRQLLQSDPIFHPVDLQFQTTFSDVGGFFSLPAFMGSYASAAAPLLFATSLWLTPVVLVSLFLSKSSFSILAAIIAVLFILWFRKRLFFWIIGAILIISSLVYVIKKDLPTGQFQRRFNVWKLIEKEAWKKQFLGHGVGTYGDKYVFVETSPSLKNAMVKNNQELARFLIDDAISQKKEEVVNVLMTANLKEFESKELKVKLNRQGFDFHIWGQAHNEFLQMFFEYGLIGLSFIILFIVDLFKRFCVQNK